jgi:alpha-methylacyl-CoA racemase
VGPLDGVRVIEIAGIGGLPYAGMMLSDLGANVVRVDRPAGDPALGAGTVLDRGRRSAAIDLKHPAGVAALLRMAEGADALIEAMRPGVAERLGIGPDECFARNPRLVYGRLTGYGQDGPLARTPGHDINFIALSGVLHLIGSQDGAPTIPLNILGDYAGGALMLVLGIVTALFERERSGEGQVVDTSMVEGSAHLATVFHAYSGTGWNEARGTNLLDGAAHFYNVYETADRGYVAVGAIEPQFYADLLRRLDLAGGGLPPQWETSSWPRMRERFAEIFRSKTRDEWERLFEGSDGCVAPVLTPREAHAHAHNATRGTFIEAHDVVQPQPTPRFSRTPAVIGAGPEPPGANTAEVLAEYGFAASEIEALRADQVVR